MALLAESLVEEWLNRQGFFTIRGLKHGVREMDILAIRRDATGQVEGRHIEVQVSFRPVGYICPLTDRIAKTSNRKKTSAKNRSEEEIRQCAEDWVEKKFLSKKKRAAREELWSGLHWSFHLVHGVVKEQKELQTIQSNQVQLVAFMKVLLELCNQEGENVSASAGGDLADILHYYQLKCALDEY